jgi:penicillin G amidase
MLIRICKGIVIFLFVMAVALGLSWMIFQMNHRAVLSGELKFSTVSNDVGIKRDNFGVPHIYAKNIEDAFWAQGFVQAQDRLAQMEFNRRFAQGRLSEILGDVVLDVDKQMRVLGVYQSAKESVGALTELAKRNLKAYADGVNAVIDSGRYSLPLALIVDKIEPWKVEDSLAMGKLIGFFLGNKEWRLKLGAGFWGDDEWDEWYPSIKGNNTVVDKEGRRQGLPLGKINLLTDREKHRSFKEMKTDLNFSKLWESGASNSLVLASKRSGHSAPLLMADPHLAPGFPDTWYTVDMLLPKQRISGASLPGAPGVVYGRNSHLAWSFTYSFVDQSQLIINPKEIKEIKHLIKIKHKKPLQFVSKVSVDGPIIAQMDGQPVALNWAVGSNVDTSSEALMRLNFAGSLKEGFNAMKYFVSPSLNLLAIDDKGHIGYHLVGKIPKRTTIQPQITKRKNQIKSLKWTEMPHALDPLAGLLVSANNAPVSNHYLYDLNVTGYELRASRILELLSKKAKWSPEALKQLQLDVKEVEWPLIKPVLSKINATGHNKDIWGWFKQWDGHCRLASKQASLYAAWLTQITKVVYDSSSRKRFPALYDFRIQRVVNVLSDEVACKKMGYVSCGHLLDVTLTRAMSSFGSIQSHENIPIWGDVHFVNFAHPVFSKIPLLGRYYRAKVAAPGGRATINRSQWSVFQQGNSVTSIPSYRMIVDMGSADYHFEYIQPLSETENPNETYSYKFLDRWAAGQYLSLNQPIQYTLKIRANKD